MEKELEILEQEFQKDFESAQTRQDLESLRIKYLGRKSQLAQLFSKIPSLSPQERGSFGRRLNSFKQKVSASIAQKSQGGADAEQAIDLTLPSARIDKGHSHILSYVNEQICSIFENLGFAVIEGGEIEDEWHNFSALNIPLEHPSRDVFDTFYLGIPSSGQGKKGGEKGKLLLRSHTSPSQIRVMEGSKPPVAVISPGRVYRPDQMDATHSFMFHQIEGFAVDEKISFAHLKGTLFHFARSFFSSDVDLRFRPHFFPFTEPSAEVDVSCIICKGRDKKQKAKGEPRATSAGGGSAFGGNREPRKCSVCKGKGWLEILGCGMIHPNVLKHCGIDPNKYQGFAFGMGVERIAMLRYGINDIRLFYDNDVRFLRQFYV